MSLVAWAFIMVAFMVIVVFFKKIPIAYAMMVGPFAISILMGNSIDDTMGFFLESFNNTMKSAGLMIIFAMLYFGMLTETGFFNRIGGAVFKLMKGKINIWAVMIMTVVLAAIGMLTATIASAYLVVFPLMLVFYEKMNFDKRSALILVTTVCAAMCFLPWGIGMALNATFAGVEIMELMVEVLPISVVFIPAIILQIIYFGQEHKRKGGLMKIQLSDEEMNELTKKKTDDGQRDMFVVNVIIFIACMVALVCGVPTYLIFMIGAMITMMINFPTPDKQGPVLGKLNGQIMGILVMLIGVSMYIGIFSSTGMVSALGEFLYESCPEPMLRYFHIILLAIAVIVIRFIPFQFYNSLLPLIVTIGGTVGLSPAFVVAAYVNNVCLGTGSSPMNATTYVGTGLLNIDVNDYAKKAVPIQTVTNVLIIIVCLVLGFM